MRRIPQSYREEIGSAKVYIEDLVEIVDILDGICEKVEIQTGDKQLDNLDELPSLQKEVINDFKIFGINPYISVWMDPYHISIYIGEDTPVSCGLFEKIKQVLLRCRRRFTWLFHNLFLISNLLTWSLIGVLWGFLTQNGFLRAYIITISLVGCFLAAYLLWDRTKQYTIIVLKNRIDRPSFVKRNKDQIFLAIISALIGAILMYLLK